jgi:hypothetical protein
VTEETAAVTQPGPNASVGGDPSVNEPQEDNGEGKAINAAIVAIKTWQDGAAMRYQDRANTEEGPNHSHKALEAGLLAGDLIRAGVNRRSATLVAIDAACIVHDSVSTIVDTSGADALVGVSALRCFGDEFATMIAGRLSAKVAV